MSKERSAFRLGDTVEWTSQARGSATTKRGRVVYVQPSGISHYGMSDPDIREAERRGWLEADAARLLLAREFVRRWDRFGPLLVQVERTGKRGQPLTPAFYSPRASALTVTVVDADALEGL